MQFNSLLFIIFLILVFILHWSVFSKTRKSQNVFLLACSLIFYSAWDYRFLSLIIISTSIDYLLALSIANDNYIQRKRFKIFLSIFSNIGLLFIFKYFNFFIQSFDDLFSLIGIDTDLRVVNIILPIGISFYTFQTLSYSIDVYKGKIDPTRDWVLFSTYVSFFPQLVAGPIERASRILPQLVKKRIFDWEIGKEGLRKILVGFFKKIIIADSLSPIVDYTFNNYNELSSFALLLGALYFTIQIYCDFSGYSDIAIGVSKLFGIKLMENFNYPYFARNIGDFWKRWHISLTTWFKDYVFIPLGGSKKTIFYSIRNVFVVFLISGLWHGANLTFVFWGLAHVLIYIPFFISKKLDFKISFLPDILKNIVGVSSTFLLVMLTWIFFRSSTIEIAWDYIFRLLSCTSDQSLILNPVNHLNSSYYLIYIAGFLTFDYYLSLKIKESIWPERIINSLLILLIIFFTQINISESFIYFQF